jgi:RNA polymerase sigma factor (sigma-70 family)
MLTQDEIEIADKVGRYYSSRWKLVERDDLTSHLYLWMAERDANQLQRWREEGSTSGKLYKSLKRVANEYCKAETSKTVNRDIYENNSYTIEIIKNTLPFVFYSPDVEDPINSKALLIIEDVSSAFYGLSPDDREVITLRYREEMSHEEMAKMFGVTVDAASQRLHRALTRLLNALSGVALWDWSEVGTGGIDDD